MALDRRGELRRGRQWRTNGGAAAHTRSASREPSAAQQRQEDDGSWLVWLPAWASAVALARYGRAAGRSLYDGFTVSRSHTSAVSAQGPLYVIACEMREMWRDVK